MDLENQTSSEKNPFKVKGHFSVTLSIQSKERRKIVTALQKDEVL